MSIIDKIKNNQIQIPIWLGQLLSFIPYSIRPVIGNQYRRSRKDINKYEQASEIERKEFIFQKTLDIVYYAYNLIPFYHNYYDECGFSPSDLTRYEDLKKIPIINKDILMSYPIEERANLREQHYIVNTGGSSGKTLNLCAQRIQMAVESAHCHKMYSVIGYHPSDLKMSIVGRKTLKNVFEYDFARHILFLNMYMPFKESANLLKKQLEKHPLHYIQGYPSIVYEFATYCQTDEELLSLLITRLKGVILNSEYPYTNYIEIIEKTFGVPCLSFYGHTERCVLACGDINQKNKYYPLQTYGYTEVVPNQQGKFHLIGTCYYNHASPLIRYDTEDIVSNPSYSNGGILTSFEMLEGRSGEFIIDNKGNKISLTGLIFGRHHKLFNECLYIQIFQPQQGFATVIYVPKDFSKVNNPSTLVDFSGIDITFDFEKRREPIRTVSGKVNLLIRLL